MSLDLLDAQSNEAVPQAEASNSPRQARKVGRGSEVFRGLREGLERVES